MVQSIVELSYVWCPIFPHTNYEHIAPAQIICFASDRDGFVDCIVSNFQFSLGRTFGEQTGFVRQGPGNALD